jgi:glycopeptide antibiotics resistance protein
MAVWIRPDVVRFLFDKSTSLGELTNGTNNEEMLVPFIVISVALNDSSPDNVFGMNVLLIPFILMITYYFY